MDAKITKTRLSRMLSYDWLKIIIAAVAAIIVWMLIFTMTATRITSAQQFNVLNYLGNTTFSTEFSKLYSKAFNDNVFSYEVLEAKSEDLANNKDYVSTIMEARMATEEGDVIFLADIDDPDTAIEPEKEGDPVTYEYTYLESFLIRYGGYIYDLDPEKEGSFFYKMEAYLDGFYNGDWENGVLDEEKVETEFRARVKKDKRFKKEAQIQQGVEDDVERIKKYRDALEKFYTWIDEGVISFTTVDFPDSNEAENVYYPKDGIYSVNLCPNESTMGGLKNYVGYQQEVTDEEGKTYYPTVAKNMNVAFFYFSGVEEGFQYESLLFVNYLIEASLAQTQTAQN